jgi:hypothetical protein
MVANDSPVVIVFLVLALVSFILGYIERHFWGKMRSEVTTWLFGLLFLCAFIAGNDWLGWVRWVLALGAFIVGALFLVYYWKYGSR